MKSIRNQNIKVDIEKYIVYDEDTNIAKCSVSKCKTIFIEKNEFTIKRHYHLVHSIDLEESDNVEINTHNSDFDGSVIEQSFSNGRNEKKYSNHLIEGFEDKGYRTFIVADYVEYCKETNISKCLIKNCERRMSGRVTGNIKRHFHKIHNFVIVHESIKSNDDNEEDVSDVSEQQPRIIINLDKYFNYDPVLNKSLCKVPGCNTSLAGKKPNNIMRHYNLVHSYRIEVHEKNDWIERSHGSVNQLSSDPVVSVDELVAYDIETASYQCLFLNCNHILEKDLNTIKNHYYETHRIIIARDADNIPNRFCRKRKYRYVHQNINDHDELAAKDPELMNVMETCLNDDEQPQCSTAKNEPYGEITKGLERKYRKFSVSSYVEYCQKTNISKCLVTNCKRLMSGHSSSNIKRHYQRVHNMIIIHGIFGKTFEIKASHAVREQNEVNVNDFVCYDIKTSSYKCLFINCNSKLEMHLNIIQSHYHKIHQIIIVRNLSNHSRGIQQSKRIIVASENPECVNKTLPMTKSNDSELEKPLNDSLVNFKEQSYTKFIIANYVEYNKEEDISTCLIKYCQKLFHGRIVPNIKTHYRKMHNMNTGIEISPEEVEEFYNELGHQADIHLSSLVVYDKNTTSYHCLFIKCNQILEKHLPTIRKHYYKVHKTVIATDSDYIIYRKRRYNELRHTEESNISDGSCAIKNELLSDEEQLSHCSKRTDNLTDYMDETMSYSIKQEQISDDEEQQLYTTMHPHNLKEKSTNVEIALTKQAFFKLCLGLVIQRDLCLNLFDDDTYFKPLLSPYERVFNCHINSGVIMELMRKSNNIIVGDLTDAFKDKILCLELHVVKHQKKYYLILNVRYLHKEIIHNKLIGFFPITEATTVAMPISEYLSKFNIDKEQVYLTTIIADLQDEEEINSICNDLCENNPNIEKHPICYFQTTLKSFLQRYSEDMRRWQSLAKYESKLNTTVLDNVKEFTNHMENLSEMDIGLSSQLMEAKYFLKTLQILRNFIDKFVEEQYVAGDFYRDWLCCELELKGELTKSNNTYAGKLYEELTECKKTLLQSGEFLAALYLDARFNFVGSMLLSEAQKLKGKMFLCTMWEKYNKYMQPANSSIDTLPINEEPVDDYNDDEYALLNQHINDTMPANSSARIEDMLTNSIPTKREPFSLDILKYWHSKRHDMKDITGITKIAFTFSSSQYILTFLQSNFVISNRDTEEFDKFLIKNHTNILDKYFELIIEDLK